ncbi:MAG: exosortase system-associated protein, TIGR04073 family [Candidatus Omnitrophota bacterium]
MKKFIAIMLTGVIFLTASIEAHAVNNPATKLGRGAANILTGVMEVPKNFMDYEERDGILAAMSVGVVVGIFKTIRRVCVGAYETVTFFYPIPEYYEPILTDPEYFLSNDE